MNATDRVGVASMQRSLRPGNLCPVSPQSASSLATALSPGPSVPGSSRMFSVVIRGNIEAEDEEITADTTEHLQDKVATFVSGMRFLTLSDFLIQHKITSSHLCIHTIYIYNYLPGVAKHLLNF